MLELLCLCRYAFTPIVDFGDDDDDDDNMTLSDAFGEFGKTVFYLYHLVITAYVFIIRLNSSMTFWLWIEELLDKTF